MLPPINQDFVKKIAKTTSDDKQKFGHLTKNVVPFGNLPYITLAP
jgi:hypothetical protein